MTQPSKIPGELPTHHGPCPYCGSASYGSDEAFERLCEAHRIHASRGGWYFSSQGTLILTGWTLRGYEYTAPSLTEKTASSPEKAPEPEENYAACSLPLASLDGHEACGRCDAPARSHRNWVETQRRRGRMI